MMTCTTRLQFHRKSCETRLKRFIRATPPSSVHWSRVLVQYAPGCVASDVLCLYDGTVFGSATDGFIFTPSTLYYHDMGSDPGMLPLRAVKSLRIEKDHLKVLCLPAWLACSLDLYQLYPILARMAVLGEPSCSAWVLTSDRDACGPSGAVLTFCIPCEL